MPGGEQRTSASFDPAAERARGQLGGFLDQIFGSPGGLQRTGTGFGGPGDAFGFGLGPGQAGTGLAGIAELFGPLQPQVGGLNRTPLQQQAVGNLSTMLGQEAPEVQAFNTAAGPLGQILTNQQDLTGAIAPVFQRNLQESLGQLQAQAPGRFGSAFLQQGTDIAQESLQDFNLFASQLAQQQMQNQLGAAQALGMLAGGAGQAPFGRALQAGQFGLGEQQFAAGLSQQGISNRLGAQNMVLNLLAGLSQPTGQVQSGGGGIGGVLGGLLGGAAGLLPGLGPLGVGLFGGGGLINQTFEETTEAGTTSASGRNV